MLISIPAPTANSDANSDFHLAFASTSWTLASSLGYDDHGFGPFLSFPRLHLSRRSVCIHPQNRSLARWFEHHGRRLQGTLPKLSLGL